MLNPLPVRAAAESFLLVVKTPQANLMAEDTLGQGELRGTHWFAVVQ